MRSARLLAGASALGLIFATVPAMADGKMDRARAAVAEARGKVDAAARAGTGGVAPRTLTDAQAALRAAEDDLKASRKDQAIVDAQNASRLADLALNETSRAQTDKAAADKAASDAQAADAARAASDAEARARAAEADANAARNAPPPAPVIIAAPPSPPTPTETTVTTSTTTPAPVTRTVVKRAPAKRVVKRTVVRKAPAAAAKTTTTVTTKTN